MTPDERDRLNRLEVSAKALEVKVDFYDRILNRIDQSLEQNSQALKSLVRLEEQHQALAKETATTAEALSLEIATRKKVEDGVFDRLRKLEGEGGMSSHFRVMAERVLLVAGGGAAYAILENAFKGAGA
jgi:hypothetical protein